MRTEATLGCRASGGAELASRAQAIITEQPHKSLSVPKSTSFGHCLRIWRLKTCLNRLLHSAQSSTCSGCWCRHPKALERPALRQNGHQRASDQQDAHCNAFPGSRCPALSISNCLVTASCTVADSVS